jgi:hypothetical protein
VPIFACSGYVLALFALVAAAQEKDNSKAGLGIVNPVPCPDINSQLPYAVTQIFVIAEIAQFNAHESPVNGDPGFGIT